MVGGDGGDKNAESGELHLALSAFPLCSPTEGLPGLRAAVSTELRCDGLGRLMAGESVLPTQLSQHRGPI